MEGSDVLNFVNYLWMRVCQMNKSFSIIWWNNTKFYASSNVFIPKESTLGILEEVENALMFKSIKVPILDLCCGIGTIGISLMLAHPNFFNSFYGFDNDNESVMLCKKNIELHKVDGEAYLWIAGDKLPKIEEGIVVCNPPFLPKSEIINASIKESLVFSNNVGLGVLLKCFQSIKGTGPILVLKSLKSQVPKILNEVDSDFSLLRQTNQEIEPDYTVAFTTWKQI